ncbi:MAG: WecB/TagA/CpsF family glycosyltransferase [Actinomycetaceae bacterium]|nr:WecB/TagA/CpsF family glycosyltransferase [Actinomycetaceae bacterium]
MVFLTQQVAGIPFAVAKRHEAVDWLLEAASARRGIAVRLSNAYCIDVASKDKAYKQVLLDGDMNFPDGTPVVWAMRGASRSQASLKPERVRGPSFFVDAIEMSQNTALSHFFLGTTDQTLELLETSLLSRFPQIRIAGMHSPPFGDLDNEFYASSEKHIRDANPDIVWIGLGTPKQDFASQQLARSIGVPCIGVGAAFDFVAGTVREAPAWCQKFGFEWLFRLLSEPRRLWKRYLFGNVGFTIEWFKGLNNG